MERIFILLLAVNVAFCNYRGSVSYGAYTYHYWADGSDNLNWNTARSKCSQQPTPMQFAMMKTYGINNAVGSYLSRYYNAEETWIGGDDQWSEGYWVWVDGTPLSSTYTNWDSGEPSSSNEDCLEMNNKGSPSLTWNDEGCGAEHGHVCQISNNRAVPSDFSQLTIYHDAASTFSEAKTTCEAIGARLVQIEDTKSKMAILRKMEGTGYEKFWVDMPNAAGTRCSVLSNFDSEDHDCNEEGFGFICETAPTNMVTVSNEQVVVAPHGDLEVSCIANGYPLPRVAWYKDDEVVQYQTFGSASSTLVIKNASHDVAGEYHCRSYNTVNGEEYFSMGLTDVTVMSN